MSGSGSKYEMEQRHAGPLADTGNTAPLFASSWMALFVLLRQEMEARLDPSAAPETVDADQHRTDTARGPEAPGQKKPN